MMLIIAYSTITVISVLCAIFGIRQDLDRERKIKVKGNYKDSQPVTYFDIVIVSIVAFIPLVQFIVIWVYAERHLSKNVLD